jgi:SNF2 family DNA or RNA helicase
MCKNPIIKENMIIENKTIKNKIKHRDLVDKPQQIIKILSEKDPKKSKILIFSENDISFDIIVKSLDNTKWKWNRIKGNTNVINSIVERYKNTDELNILFINAKCFGSGLNLENTTDIMIYHKLDKDLENQVIGRGQRIGRTCPLKVWKLSYPNE